MEDFSMSQQFLRLCSVVFLATSLFCTGCGKKDSEETAPTDTPTPSTPGTLNTNASTTFLLTATKDTAPVIIPGTLVLNLMSPLNGPYQYVFDTLRSWDPATDNGKVDMSNIYHVLDVTGEKYQNAARSGACTAFSVRKVVKSPFIFADFEDSYACAANNGAMGEAYPFSVAADEEGTNAAIKHLLTGFVWAGTATTGEYNVIQGKFTEATKALTLRFAQVVDHDQSRFSRRTSIDGNAGEHSFTIRSVYGSMTGPTSSYSIVGKGISQGDGKYFLFKVRASDAIGNDKYICFKAGSKGEDLLALQTVNASGSTTVDTNCSAYQTDVDAMTFFTYADMPHTAASFTGKGGSSILLDF